MENYVSLIIPKQLLLTSPLRPLIVCLEGGVLGGRGQALMFEERGHVEVYAIEEVGRQQAALLQKLLQQLQPGHADHSGGDGTWQLEQCRLWLAMGGCKRCIFPVVHWSGECQHELVACWQRRAHMRQRSFSGCCFC